MEIQARNVNDAYKTGLWWLSFSGVKESSKHGEILATRSPVMTVYCNPDECVLFDGKRDANPYFHLMEALWMLAGRYDVDWLAQFNPHIRQYSDDHTSLHGAYGYRWREHFGTDQLDSVERVLKTNPETHRAVLAMWSPSDDLEAPSLDIPCNTHVYFDLRSDKLNITVCCRSNDAVWGCYGIDAVHFSFLQQYLAGKLGKPVGVYRQFSNNFYLHTEKHGHLIPPGQVELCPYSRGLVKPYPLMENNRLWISDLNRFLADPLGGAEYANSFFSCIAAPMYASWTDRQTKKNNGLPALQRMPKNNDWKLACENWIKRRLSHADE